MNETTQQVAKILLGSSERHRLPTTVRDSHANDAIVNVTVVQCTQDYLASLLDGTTEINRVGKVVEYLMCHLGTHARILEGFAARRHGRDCSLREMSPQGLSVHVTIDALKEFFSVNLKTISHCHSDALISSLAQIERLFLSGNNLGVPGAQQLCNLILDQSLRLARLDLRHNNLGRARRIGCCKRLICERMTGNEGCILILEAVAENKTINRIDLSANGITAQAAPAIAQVSNRA